MPNSYNAPNVICPFYHHDRQNQIFCEAVVDGALSTCLNFAGAKEAKDYLESFCSDECYQGCPIYLAIRQKYDP